MVRRRFEQIAAMFGSLSLTAKGVLVVAIPVAALLVAMAVFYLFQQQSRQAQDWVEHTFQVRAEINRVSLLLARAETSSRGYLLTQDKNSEDRYAEAVRELPAPLDALDRLTRDNPAQAPRLADIRSRIEAAMNTMESIRRDAAAHRMDAGFEQLAASRQQMRDLRAPLDAMQAEEDSLLAARTAREQQAQRKLEAAVFAGGLLGLLGGVLAALLFGSSIVRRVHRLEADAMHMAAGEPVTNRISGKDELAVLGRTLQGTSALLAAQSEELRAARADLENRVQQRTHELMAANEELHRANEVRRALVHSSPLAIWALDFEGNVTFWNPAAERIFGYSEAEVLHRPPPVVPPDQQVEYGQWVELFRSGGSVLAAERVRRKKDGSRIDVIIWTAPLRDARGKVTGTLVIDSDVTERKLLEEQFRQSQKLEAVGRLAGGVAHDFNNLLTVIIGYVEMLIGEARDQPNLVEYAQEIQQAAMRAGSLTGQLLAFSRRQITQPKVLDINEVVNRSLRMLGRVIGEDVEIVPHLAERIGKVRIDPTHIDQLLMNLVVNARDAMPKGGTITIETANVELDEHYAGRHIGVQPGTFVMLAVSDTGTGMTAETKSRLFEPFFTTKEAGKGTGLGLSIVYGIVKQAGGEILVYSELGHGTTFKIYLPLSQTAAETAASERQAAQLLGTETVLLCEDEVAIRKVVQSILSKNGYRVLEAESPQRALEIARDHSGEIHLLLTDIVMPHISGFELAREILSMRPRTKVLYMSGYTDNRVSASWVFDQSIPFLHKPFTLRSLAEKVREALDQAASHKPGNGGASGGPI